MQIIPEYMKAYQFLAVGSRLHAAEGRVRSRTGRERLDKTGGPQALWPLAAKFYSPLGRCESCPGHLKISTKILINDHILLRFG